MHIHTRSSQTPHRSFPPMSSVIIFQSSSQLTPASSLIRFTSFSTLAGMCLFCRE